MMKLAQRILEGVGVQEAKPFNFHDVPDKHGPWTLKTREILFRRTGVLHFSKKWDAYSLMINLDKGTYEVYFNPQGTDYRLDDIIDQGRVQPVNVRGVLDVLDKTASL